MKWVDSIRVFVKGGSGGPGCLSFRKERFLPKGGPDGGDGGRGGSVFFVGDSGVASLLPLCYNPRFVAEDGHPGKANRQSGKSGNDLTVRVPVGTVLVDVDSGKVLKDLDREGECFVAAKGGRGGRGNARFTTPTDRAPRRVEKGGMGESRWIRLELKLPAEVGLIGRPNSGKSTILSRISSASPRIAEYPFTTTSPNVGVVTDDEYKSFTVVDTPGIAQDASQGRGLGIGFLRHIERTRLLVHVIDIAGLSEQGAVDDHQMIMAELKAFNPRLGEKPQIVAINKVDLIKDPQHLETLEAALGERGIPAFPVSGLTGQGLSRLVREMARRLGG
ncbi:MAG: GTPase ObgE [Deltaproteobacteria bacterium]|nr:GTPase ObgE [Deltaproteobacteria bacterium]